MPRPKSITWEKRVQVYLAYRQIGGKVNPVAKRYGIARSTVNVIVGEFVKMGFSEKPRAKVSADLLSEMQKQHVANLLGLPLMGVGQLNLGPGTGNDAERQKAMADPLPIQDETLSHLRGTKAEQVIEEAKNANRDYLRRESEAWQGLRLALEAACRLPERDGDILQDPEPHLLPALTRRLHTDFLVEAFRATPPPLSWLRWDLDPKEPRVLRLQGERIGIGNTEDQEGIKEGLTNFLANGFPEHQRRFQEVERLRQDMALIQGIVSIALGEVTEDDIGRGICPACPYPEATLDLNPGPRAKKRRADEE